MHSLADKIPESEIANFKVFCTAFTLILGVHHRGEEMFMFPAIKEMCPIEENLHEHHAIHDGVDKLTEYLAKDSFNGAEFIAILDSFGQAMHDHLSHEISTIQGHYFRKGGMKGEDLFKVVMSTIEWEQTQVDPTLLVPFVIVNHDVSTNNFWPPVPPEVLIAGRTVLSVPHAAYV